jgi:sortase A
MVATVSPDLAPTPFDLSAGPARDQKATPSHARAAGGGGRGSSGRGARKGSANRKTSNTGGGRGRGILATLLILAGLAMGGYWLWSTFGTTWLVRGQMAEQIDAFTSTVPDAPAQIADLGAQRTDFEATPPPEIDMATLSLGEAFGVLTVPTWQGQMGAYDDALRNKILVTQGGHTEAETTRILNRGVAAHYIETAGPGEIGNFSISAHRRSYGDNFLHLVDLVEGDWVLLETADTWYVYKVIGSELVLPTETRVINPDPFVPVDANGQQFPTRRLITMTTCTLPNGSPWGNSHRWVVHGELYGWMPRSEGIPPMIDAYWDEATSPMATT